MYEAELSTGDSRTIDALQDLLEPGAITVVYQPVVALTGGSVVGYEALARFDSALPLRTDEWFTLAWRTHLGPELELACWAAIADNGPPPEHRLLFVNCRPDLLVDPRARAARERLPANLVLELSEQDEVRDYPALHRALRTWTAQGDRIAIDDTGAGYASLRHVVQLEPDFVKLDRSLIDHIDVDRNRRAMVCALVAYAQEAGAAVIAEGVERSEELAVLRDLGVHLAQGYLLARPDAPWSSTVWAPRLAAATGADGGEQQLRTALAACDDARSACEVTAEYLARTGDVMPSVYLERDGVLRCQAQRGLWQVLDGMPPEAGITGRAFRTDTAVMVPDIRSDDAYLEAIPGVRAEVCAPIRMGGMVVGAVNIESYAPLAHGAALTLTRACALLGERLAVVGLGPVRTSGSRLPRVATALAGIADEHELRQRLCRAACDLAGMNSAVLSLAEPSAEERSVMATGPLEDVLLGLDDHQHLQLGQLVAEVASCYTAGDSTGACFRIAQSLRTAGARSVVILPLDARGRRLGFLLVAHTAPVRIITDEVETLELLATHAALCLETARLVEDWRRKAATDPLTGLGNHAAFRSALDRRQDDGSRAALLMADVDSLKSINDRFGHLVGDEVLQQVAQALRDSVRPGDELFRIGGDEFAVLVRNAGPAELADVGRRIRQIVDRGLRVHGAAVSIGGTVLDPSATPEQMIERADASLYEAKRLGGNRLQLAG